MARPTPLSGFPELLPADRVVEAQAVEALRSTFELHGFAEVETRAVEPLDVLLRKGEIDKEVYVVKRLHAAADDAADLALHFDLTVPFARYVLENAGRLQFPFRRYQVQKVWRGERPQEGRFREFRQADIDVVDVDELAPHHDVEVAAVMAEAMRGLPLPPARLQVNNRKLIEGFYRGLGAEEPTRVMQAVDKLDKIGPDGVARLLAEAGLSAGAVSATLALAEVRGGASVVDAVRGLGVEHPLLDTGLEELVAVLEGTAEASDERVRVEADLRIARGLDYYTGTVYETRLVGFESLGAVAAGGRYDALASDGKRTYPGVGISFGVTRTLVPLVARGLTGSRAVPSAVLVALPDEASRAASAAVAQRLRRRGIACEVAPRAAKFGKQIAFADKRGIPFVWFPQPDGGHEVKDIRSGEQVVADPDSWTPAAEDLRPAVVVPPTWGA